MAYIYIVMVVMACIVVAQDLVDGPPQSITDEGMPTVLDFYHRLHFCRLPEHELQGRSVAYPRRGSWTAITI